MCFSKRINIIRNMSNRVQVSVRLREALKLRAMTQSELSIKSGISDSKISSYLNGRYEPKSNGIDILSKILKVNPAWLAGFDVPMEEGSVFKADDLTITIPFVSQKLSAGRGENFLSDDDIEVRTISISAYLARGIDKATLLAAEVRGDSMIDEKIFSGDIVVFSRGLIRQEGIYVINYAGDLMVKKLSFDALNGRIDIISGNRNYPTRTVDAELIEILGKVVGWIHRLDF